MQVIDTSDQIKEVENIWIPLPDGRKLAARAWFPVDSSDTKPYPVILEYSPYRKRDGMRLRDEGIYRYFASQGYACVRVDIAGTGDSDGVMQDEYSKDELDGGAAVLDWLSKQPWSTGKVGMIGASWTGFNALQIAALNPPALKAIIPACFTDDRYADDVHYMGGCLLYENMNWGAYMDMLRFMPPDPEIVGAENWRDMWKQRMDAVQPLTATWLQHQERDAYWKHGSVCEDYSRITCPVYASSGWADGYSNAVPRLLANIDVPKKGLVGAWMHGFPHNNWPGPTTGFLQDAVRWWDRWLKGVENGVENGPEYTVFMQGPLAPSRVYEDDRPGRWVTEDQWPSPRIQPQSYTLGAGGLLPPSATVRADELSIKSPANTGTASGAWVAMYSGRGEFPSDQRYDDAGSLVFDTLPLTETTEILGASEVTLRVKSDKTVALAALRLCDVWPDGTSERVTYGLKNLTHRDSDETPEILEPGKWYDVKVKLNDCAFSFKPGHKIRLALSTNYWPLAWPSPEAATLTVKAGESGLILPVRPERAADADMPSLGEPLKAAAGSSTYLDQDAPDERSITTDLATGVHTYTCRRGDWAPANVGHLDDIGLEMGHQQVVKYTLDEKDPLSAKAEFMNVSTYRRAESGKEWDARIEVRSVVTATADAFHVVTDVRADDKPDNTGEAFFTRHWEQDIPRRFL